MPLVMEDPDPDEKENPMVLVKNVKAFEMQFLDSNKNPPEWVDDWTAAKTNQLPKMVMISMTIADNPKNPQAVDEITRIISLPAVTVQPMWQVPNGQSSGGAAESAAVPAAGCGKPEPRRQRWPIWHAAMRMSIANEAERGAPRCRQGIALIIVMISIFVLSMLAGGFAYSMKVETKLARNGNSEEQLEWLGRSGVEYARWILAQQLMIPAEPYDGLDQVWAGGPGGIGTSNSPLADVQKEVQLGDGTFKWEIKDLERKWNINALVQPGGQDLLQNAFTLMNMDAGDVTPLANSILNWMDKGTRIQGATADDYSRMNPAYSPKNGPIDDLSEPADGPGRLA